MYNVSPIAQEYAYGGADLASEFVRRCRRCNGITQDTIDTTGVPDSFREADISKFDFDCYKVNTEKLKEIAHSFFDVFPKWRKKGKGIYFFSKTPGSGKTFLACCLAKSVMMRYGLRMRFITAPDYIDKVSQGYTLAKQGITDSPANIYKECELLILDDIGVQLGNDWQNQELFKLINDRITNGLVTIYTSNYDIAKVNVDERVRSRIYGTTVELQMPEESVRVKKANEEQAEFLKGVLG